MVSDSNQKCKRSYPFYPRIQRYRRKLLADYCEERDKRRREVISSSTDKDKCLEFNEWVIMSDNAINDSFNNKITEGDRNKGAYTISNSCSLRKPHLLFPLLECHEEKKKEEEPEKKSDSDDEDLNKPKIPEQDHKNVIPGIIGFSNSPSYVGFNPVHAESGMFGHSSPGLTFDKLNMFFDSPIFGHSKITGTAEGFGNIFNMHIEPKDVAIPFDTSPPVSIPASNVTVGSNTPVKITPYLMFTPAVLLIVFISIILNLMNKKKPMIPVKIKEKIKVKSEVPSTQNIRIEELEKLRQGIRETKIEKLKKKIHVPKKIEIIEDPYKIKLLERKKWLWKTIIEIHMLILEEQRKAEWEFNKGDFLNICIDEFSNQEKKTDTNIITSDLLFDEPEVIETIRMNWKNEEHKYMRKAYLELLMSLREDVKNPMLQRQKIIWRKWIAKNLYHIESNVMKKWFDKLLEEILRKGAIEEDECINLIEMEENEEYLEELKEYRKKKLICIIWIKIYMMIIEEHKKEEYLESKEIFLDTCVDELKEQEILEGNELYMDDMKKSILLSDQKEEIEKLKMKNWYKDLKKEWMSEEDRYFRSIINEEDDEEYKNMISRPLRDIEKKISKKHWDDIQLKWIDEDNERDWLKIARNENDEDNYAYEYVRNRRKKYMDVYSEYYKRNRKKSGDKISGNEISGNEISGNKISGNKISGKINKINTEKEILNYDIIKEDNNNNDYMNNYMYYNDMENTYEQGSDYRRKDEYFDICFDLLKKGNIGDKYHMSQRQKIIWRKWIAKHPIRVREFVIDKWFNQLFEELEKEGIISDEAIRNFLSQHKEAYDEEKIEAFIKYKKKLLVVILWIKIYMSMLEEYVKEEDIESEKLFIDTSLEELKKKKEIEEEVLEDLKKDIYEIDEKKEIEKYKGEDWFKQMQQDWIRRDYKFVSSYNLESDDEKQFHEPVKKPTMEIQKDLLKEQWKNIEVKWIEEDNYDAYLLEDKLLKKTKYIKPKDKMKHRIIKEDDIYSEQLKIFDEIEKRSIYLSSKKVLKWKTIIEIHLEVLHDCKKEEWDKNKRDFLNICIEELVKGQNEDKKNKENYNYITNESDNYDIVEYTKSFCNTWKDRHNYMLEKWNKENWFVQLKNDWKKEQNEYMRKTYKELLISLKGDKYNMSQRQKIIWKKWIAKHPNKMNEEIINIWSNQLSDEIDKNGIISDEAIKNFLSLEKDISDKDLLKCRKKKLEVILWVKIYMSVLEKEKNEELEKSKESFLNTCIDELKKEEPSEENERMIIIADEMKKGFRIITYLFL
ncbi:hypothetical protein PFFCH_01646 [Plasmodium falciparum FCH/4]|uniref:Schizont-infected cell agglutination C-terminal domain-containing protein n=1 Tax=Plasmodium falciparum FCH/4 TaxID=1036724 RepID=A0A024VQD2_PLAFA|nr:hypothetical protein PFFCH_01646 [Plasmodium falciparum FCH/4]